MSSARSAKVRVFIDFWNFSKSWEGLTGLLPEENLDWAEFPGAILDGLDQIPLIRNVQKELRAVKVYASVKPADFFTSRRNSEREVDEERRRHEWLTNHLDQLTAYAVDVTVQANRTQRCYVCDHDTGQVFEQGVDTKIAIDLVSLASRHLYDIAVLVTDDQDLVPSTQCVQEALQKKVVHLGVKKLQKSDVQLEAWGHLHVDDMLSRIAL